MIEMLGYSVELERRHSYSGDCILGSACSGSLEVWVAQGNARVLLQ